MAVVVCGEQLFTGAKDGFVKVWSIASGEKTGELQMGGEVHSLCAESGYVFAGLVSGTIKCITMADGSVRDMVGHTGCVNDMCVAGEHLFSASADTTIRAWKFDAAQATFVGIGVMNGHAAAVQTLANVGGRLFSGGLDNAVFVWDAANGGQLQQLAGHAQPVTKVLCWNTNAITCDMGGVICVWGRPTDAAGNEDTNAPFAGVYQFPEGGNQGETYVTMCGTADGEGKAVLLCANPLDNVVRILELPTFADRGIISERKEVKAIAAAGPYIFVGVDNGSVKIFSWRQPR
eukprot:PRCOL_00000177-RA